MKPTDAKAFIRGRAAAEGLDAVGFVSPNAIPAAPARLAAFLAEGRHGSMDWLAASPEIRSAPASLWPNARSIVMIGQNYGPSDDPLATLENPSVGGVSVYARGRDYHDVVKGKIKNLAGVVASKFGVDVKVFVDTAPVMEKPLAAAAGLGWQGKHTNLVSRDFGSWLFLGAIFTTLDLAPDEPETDHCGACRRCLDVCPTDAFPAPYQLDARRCVAYLTIEHKGPIPLEFRAAIGNRIFGCDDCLAVCPWNKFAETAREARLAARDELNAPPLCDLVALDDAAFRKMFSGSPIKRTGRDRFVRNVLIAIGNSGDRSFLPLVIARFDDDAAIVRGAAAWAARRLTSAAEWESLTIERRALETDPDARAEWADGSADPATER